MLWKWVFWISKHIKIRTYNRNKKLFFWTFPSFKITPWNVNNTILFLQNHIKASEWNFFETFFSDFFECSCPRGKFDTFLYADFCFFSIHHTGLKIIDFELQTFAALFVSKKVFFPNFFHSKSDLIMVFKTFKKLKKRI